MTQQHDAPVNITSARTSRSADIKRREVKYLISMGIRTVCFVLAVVLTGPLRWVMVSAAFLLPYFAVVIANAADGRTSDGPQRFEDEQLPQIGAGHVPDAPSKSSS
jgi:hypothetical protein